MKKLILAAILFTVILAPNAKGQTATATIADVVAAPGTQVVVPVNITGFNNVSAMTLYIEFDPAVVTFVGSQNPAVGFQVFAALYPDGKWRVGLAWSTSGSVNIPDGKLVDLIFNYAGGEGEFVWSQEFCQVTLSNYQSLSVLYTDGSIGPVGEATVTLVDQPNAVPGPLSIPLNVDLSNVVGGVGSFTFEILYDENILAFQSVSNVSTQFPGIGVYTFTSPTRIVLDYVNSTQSSNLVGTLLNLNFTYTGGNTALTFNESACAMANDEVVEVSVIYTPALITQDPGSLLTISLPDATADPGTQVSLPLSVTNFNNIASFDLRIVFDPSVLTFVGLANYASPLAANQFQVNVSGNLLGISWNETGGPVTFAAEDLFDIVFNYTTGNSTLVFDEDVCEVADDDLNPQVVVYYDGSVGESIQYDATATIANMLATTGQPVNVPVTVTGFDNLGAINFDIEYNPAVMTFSEIINVHPLLDANGTFSFNAVGGHVYFEWALNSLLNDGPDIPDLDKLFDLRFSFIGGSSSLTFITGNCEVSQDDFSSILVSYYNGSVVGGIVSLVESTITANPVEVELNAPSVITVQLKDQLGNNLPGSGGTVALFTTLGSLTAVTDNYDGTYTATLTAGSSGIATITGTLNGDPFADDATVKVFFLLTLEIAGNGKVSIGGTEYTQASQVISVTTPTVLLESVPVSPWQLYSWKEGAVVQTPLGAATYTVTMDSDKTVLATFHLPGDANCNGTVTTADILTVTNYIKLLNPSPFCYENADVNRSNNISTADILGIVNIIKNQ